MAKKVFVRCLNCRFAYLRRPGSDPVLAKCAHIAYNEVASRLHTCAYFEKGAQVVHPEPPIKQWYEKR